MTDPEDRPTGGASNDDGPDGDGGPGDEELAEMADDLSDVLRDLRDELRASREARDAEAVEPPSGSSGGAVPDVSIDLPSATDVLAFTDEKLIPAAITVLEVNIRALELLQKGIRWARPDRAGENARAVQSHAESVSRSTLERLDTVLADLQEAATEGSLPGNAEAGGIITEARRLRDEIDAALEERAEARGEAHERDALPDYDTDGQAGDEDGPPSPWGEQPDVDVDVEGELHSIKAELGKVDDEDDAPPDGEADEETELDEGAGDEADGGAEADGDDPAPERGDEPDSGRTGGPEGGQVDGAEGGQSDGAAGGRAGAADSEGSDPTTGDEADPGADDESDDDGAGTEGGSGNGSTTRDGDGGADADDEA